MRTLSKQEAETITEVTSAIFPQGASWVLREWDLDSGTERLTRGLSEQLARRKLKVWRKERLEQLLRANGERVAFTVRVFKKNPSWNGEGIWQWAARSWYTTEEDALEALEQKAQDNEDEYQVFELPTSEIPGSFVVAS